MATGHLEALHREGLLTEAGYRRYGMHDLIRRYAQELAAAGPRQTGTGPWNGLPEFCTHIAEAASLAEPPTPNLSATGLGGASCGAGPAGRRRSPGMRNAFLWSVAWAVAWLLRGLLRVVPGCPAGQSRESCDRGVSPVHVPRSS